MKYCWNFDPRPISTGDLVWWFLAGQVVDINMKPGCRYILEFRTRNWNLDQNIDCKSWTWNLVEQVLREVTWPPLSSMMPRLERGSPCQGFKLSYSFDCTTSEEVNILVIANLFRCASISWIHVGKSVSHSVIDVFEILSNLEHIFRLSSGYVQGMLIAKGMFRLASE